LFSFFFYSSTSSEIHQEIKLLFQHLPTNPTLLNKIKEDSLTYFQQFQQHLQSQKYFPLKYFLQFIISNISHFQSNKQFKLQLYNFFINQTISKDIYFNFIQLFSSFSFLFFDFHSQEENIQILFDKIFQFSQIDNIVRYCLFESFNNQSNKMNLIFHSFFEKNIHQILQLNYDNNSFILHQIKQMYTQFNLQPLFQSTINQSTLPSSFHSPSSTPSSATSSTSSSPSSTTSSTPSYSSTPSSSSSIPSSSSTPSSPASSTPSS
jgi:hypothetical protein